MKRAAILFALFALSACSLFRDPPPPPAPAVETYEDFNPLDGLSIGEVKAIFQPCTFPRGLPKFGNTLTTVCLDVSWRM